MNYTPVTGWYYAAPNDRTAAWTGVEYLYRFLIGNEGLGPFGEETPLERLLIGDLVQLGTEKGDFYHTPIVCAVRQSQIYVAAHSFDTYRRPLSDYDYAKARGIRIAGVRVP